MTGVVVLLALIAGLAAFAVPKVCQYNQTVVLNSLIERHAFAHVRAEEADGSIFDVRHPETAAREIAAELGGEGCAYGRACPNHCPVGGIFSVTFEQGGNGDAVFMVKCSRHGDGMTDRLTMQELTALLECLRDYWRERIGGGARAAEGRAAAVERDDRFPSAASGLPREAARSSGSLPEGAEHAAQLLGRLSDLQAGRNAGAEADGSVRPMAFTSMMPKDFPSFLNRLRELVPAGSGGSAPAQFLDGLPGDLVPAVRRQDLSAPAVPEADGTAEEGAAEGGISWKASGRKTP